MRLNGGVIMSEYVLKTENLTKRYKNNAAVDHVNLSIKKGDIYGFIGRNGAGKTTMIRMITGLITPTSGSIQLFSEKDTDSQLLRIGSIIEQPALHYNYTAYENMELRGKLLGIPDQRLIQEILKIVNLVDVQKRKVKNFSLGMRQRLGVALALLGHPDFLILDEPINGLDPEGIVAMRKLLTKLNEEQNITILISSHILGELSKLATRYGVINNGVLMEEFSHEELEQRNQKYLEIQVDDTAQATFILEDVFQTVNYIVEPENTIKIFDLLEMSSEIVLELAQNNIRVLSIESKGGDLEEYFMNLMKGDQV